MFQWPHVPFRGGVREGNSNHRYSGRSPSRLSGLAAATAFAGIGMMSMSSPGLATEAAEIFGARCSACHTVGQGDKVGPDLHGVHDRREADWLQSFIRSSQSVIASGDATARDLYQRFDQRTMPDQDLGRDEIEELITWIAAGGPSLTPTFRSAFEASDLEAARGRALFYDRSQAHMAGCSGCHSLAEDEGRLSQSLGGSLSHVFSRYRDAELSRHLEAPVAGISGARCQRSPLDADAAFHLRAFFHRVDQDSVAKELSARSLPMLGATIALVLLLIVQLASGWRPSLRPRARARRQLHLDRLS